MPVSAINEGSGALAFVEVVDGNLEVRDGRRTEINGAAWIAVEMRLLRQSLLHWGAVYENSLKLTIPLMWFFGSQSTGVW